MLHISEERVIAGAIEQFLAKKLARYAGELTGAQTVAAHKCVTDIVCKDKWRWDLFECIVDEMDAIYKRVAEVGFEAALKERGCEVP